MMMPLPQISNKTNNAILNLFNANDNINNNNNKSNLSLTIQQQINQNFNKNIIQHNQHQQQPNSNKQINYSRYKTELCRQYNENGECKYGDKCQFAHGFLDLKDVSRHPKYKTDFCKTFHSKGFCPYGPRCHFIHDLNEKFDASSSINANSNIKNTKKPSSTSLSNKAKILLFNTNIPNNLANLNTNNNEQTNIIVQQLNRKLFLLDQEILTGDQLIRNSTSSITCNQNSSSSNSPISSSVSTSSSSNDSSYIF